jgi:hypothetical protein
MDAHLDDGVDRHEDDEAFGDTSQYLANLSGASLGSTAAKAVMMATAAPPPTRASNASPAKSTAVAADTVEGYTPIAKGTQGQAPTGSTNQKATAAAAAAVDFGDGMSDGYGSYDTLEYLRSHGLLA